MRKRPLSHQLEDQSKTAFRAILPKEWVVREKSHDYGIDLEVEIFDKDGASTGAVFLVQLKATASKKAATQASIQMAVSAMEYIGSLDLPVLIARYSSKKDIFFVKWAHEVPLFKKQPDQKQVSIRFEKGDGWSENSAEKIQKTVFAIRRLRELSAKSTIPIFCRFEVSNKNLNTARFQRVVRSAISSLSQLHLVPDNPQDKSTVEVVIRDDHIFLSIDGLWPTTSPICDDINKDLTASLLYALSAQFSRAKLYRHSEIIAKYLHGNKITIGDRQLAFGAACSLFDEPKRSIELATLNGLHKQIDEWFTFYVPLLRISGSNDSGTVDSVVEFCQSALDAVGADAPRKTIAGLNYSIANVYRAANQYHRAIHYYNRARKQDPAYLEREYFLYEVGSTFFFSGKYRCAAAAYEMLVAENSDQTFLFCYGDALFFSGRIGDASIQFAKLGNISDLALHTEVYLKSCLIDWLRERTGKDTLHRNTKEASLIFSDLNGRHDNEAIKELERVLLEVDPLHGGSAFNLGISYSKQERRLDALMLFLIQAFRMNWDGEAWANAVACAFSKEIPRDVFVTCIALAQRLGGDDFNEAFDKVAKNNEFPDEMVAAFDKILEELQSAMPDEGADRLVTLRLLKPDGGVDILELS